MKEGFAPNIFEVFLDGARGTQSSVSIIFHFQSTSACFRIQRHQFCTSVAMEPDILYVGLNAFLEGSLCFILIKGGGGVLTFAESLFRCWSVIAAAQRNTSCKIKCLYLCKYRENTNVYFSDRTIHWAGPGSGWVHLVCKGR